MEQTTNAFLDTLRQGSLAPHEKHPFAGAVWVDFFPAAVPATVRERVMRGLAAATTCRIPRPTAGLRRPPIP